MAYIGTKKVTAYFNGKRISFICELMEYTLAGLSSVSLAELNGLTLIEMK